MSVPGWAVAVLRLVAAPGRSEDAIGDLNELHGRRLARHARVIAHLVTTLAVLDMAQALFRQRLRMRRRERRVPRGDRPRGRYREPRSWDMVRWIDEWRRNLAQAFRSLARAPGFAVVTVLTLALAIGANTAIYSVVETVLLDPLAFPDADRLVSIRASVPGSDMPDEFSPGPEFHVQYREQADMLEDLGMYVVGQTTVRADDQIDRLFITQNTPTLFSTLQVRPELGRLPNEQDDPGSVILLSQAFWETWFGSDPSIIGRSIEVSGRMHEVIGIMPADFRFPEARVSIWLHQMIQNPDEVPPGGLGFNLVGRVRPGVSPDDLVPQLASLASRLPERFGGSPRYAELIAGHRPIVRTLAQQMVGDVSRPLWLLLGTVGVVLLIACANVANLFGVRAEARSHDLHVRQALGAGRGELIRAQMTEALVLAGLGGTLGVALAWIGLPLIVRAAPESIPNLDLARLDGGALLFTAGLTILTACAFGLAPALRLSMARPVGALRQSGGVGRTRSRGRDALVLMQTASALVLLVGSGLLMRSFWTLSHVDPGYDTEDIFTFQVAPQRDELSNGEDYARFHEGFMAEVAGLPGVESVGLTLLLPLDEGAASARFVTEQTEASGATPPVSHYTAVGGDYFGTMDIELVRGRLFEPDDHRPGPTGVVVSEAAARQLWPGEDAIGRLVKRRSTDPDWLTVVGIVEDIFVEDFRQDAPDPMIYLPMVGPAADSWTVGSPAYVVKTPRAGVIAPEIRALIREHAPESPMYRIFTLQALAERSMAQLSFTMLMLGLASGLALVLGPVGLYGVLSYVVSRRTREIAVRMALGAEARRVRRMVVVQGARITALGVVIGLGSAVALTRLLSSLLFGVGALDAPTYAGMSTVMITVALLASYLPARRASRVDPMQSLRAE